MRCGGRKTTSGCPEPVPHSTNAESMPMPFCTLHQCTKRFGFRYYIVRHVIRSSLFKLKKCSVNIQLPDLRYLDCRVDFSIKTFGAVVNLCKDLDIRHPEELSLSKPLDPVHLKKNFSEFPKRKLPMNEHGGGDYQPAADTNTFIPNSSFNGSSNSLDRTNGLSCAPIHHRPAHLMPPGHTPISSPTGVSSLFPDLDLHSLNNSNFLPRPGNVVGPMDISTIRQTLAPTTCPRIWPAVHERPVQTSAHAWCVRKRSSNELA